MGKKRSHSSQRWLQEHLHDPFVIQAKQQGLRSRAHFKLAEIQEKTNLIKPGQTVLDLGGAPGAWSVLASKLAGQNGRVITCDLLPMQAIPNHIFIQGDFDSPSTQAEILSHTPGGIDVILCDIAPNTCGIKAADQLKAMQICEAVLAFCITHLPEQGVGLIKVFHGLGFDALLKTAKQHFMTVKTYKPKASRNRSAECYLFLQNRRTG